MKIPCYFDNRFEPPAPFVRITMESKSLKMKRPLRFHIDTGASLTVLLDKDAHYLGIDVRKLNRPGRNIGGLGGLIPTYVIEDAALSFTAEDGQVIQEKLHLFLGIHHLSMLSAEEKALIMRMPSLLGRDIIYRFRLVCDRNRNQVYLQR